MRDRRREGTFEGFFSSKKGNRVRISSQLGLCSFFFLLSNFFMRSLFWKWLVLSLSGITFSKLLFNWSFISLKRFSLLKETILYNHLGTEQKPRKRFLSWGVSWTTSFSVSSEWFGRHIYWPFVEPSFSVATPCVCFDWATIGLVNTATLEKRSCHNSGLNQTIVKLHTRDPPVIWWRLNITILHTFQWDL